MNCEAIPLFQWNLLRPTESLFLHLFRGTTNSMGQGRFIGTPYYMSPEAFNGSNKFARDIWALGVVLYELAALKLPFTGRNKEEIKQAVYA